MKERSLKKEYSTQADEKYLAPNGPKCFGSRTKDQRKNMHLFVSVRRRGECFQCLSKSKVKVHIREKGQTSLDKLERNYQTTHSLKL